MTPTTLKQPNGNICSLYHDELQYVSAMKLTFSERLLVLFTGRLWFSTLTKKPEKGMTPAHRIGAERAFKLECGKKLRHSR